MNYNKLKTHKQKQISKYTNVTMFSNNCNGAKLKVESLKSELKRTNSSIFTLQETHFAQKGRIKIDNFKVFEAIHRKEHGIMMGVHMDLNPILISEHSELFEMLVVQVTVDNKDIRIITGYGPQENIEISKRMPFFAKLEEEVLSAKLGNKSLVIQMDANSKLGEKLVPNDPKEQTPNGAVLADILERNNLIVANAITEKCRGLITRRRVVEGAEEKSIIDFLILSVDMAHKLERLIIDEDKEYALTNITKKNNAVHKVNSDHNVLISHFNLKVEKRKGREKGGVQFQEQELSRKIQY